MHSVSTSDIPIRLDETKAHLASCDASLITLREQDEKLLSLLTNKMTGVDDRFTKSEASALDHQNYMEQKIIELKHYVAKANDSIFKLQDFQKDSIRFQEKTRNDHAAT
jgi:hypothetical protein